MTSIYLYVDSLYFNHGAKILSVPTNSQSKIYYVKKPDFRAENRVIKNEEARAARSKCLSEFIPIYGLVKRQRKCKIVTEKEKKNTTTIEDYFR